jgi:Fibronectin type III domain
VQLLKSATLIAACLFVLVGQNVQAAPLSLAWDPPETGSPAGYILGYGTQSGVYTGIVDVGPSTFITLDGLTEGHTYFFVVVAYSASGAISLPTPELNRAMCSGAPSAPGGMSVSVSGTLVNVAWAPSSGGVSSYVVHAGATPGSTSISVPVAGTSISAHAPPGTYYLRTAAVNACGVSGLSGEIVATVGGSAEALPGTPRSLTRSVTGSAVRLSWVQPSSGGAVQRYIIEAMNGSEVIGAIDTGSANTSVSHPAVPPGRYVVRVRGANSAGVGPPSSTVTVVVP